METHDVKTIMDLTKVERRILLRIASKGACTFHRLSLEGFVNSSHTDAKKSLIKKGLVELRTRDKRSKLIYLTPKGVEIATELLEVLKE